MSKRDQRRHRYANAMAAYRKLWARQAFNTITRQIKNDNKLVKRIIRTTDDPQVALDHIKSYFEGNSRLHWAHALKTVWKTTGNEAMRVTNDLLTGKDFMRTLTGTSFYGEIGDLAHVMIYQGNGDVTVKAGAIDAADSSWDQVVEDKITGHDNKVVGITDESYGKIQKEMVDGQKEGLSHYEIGQNIEQHLDESWKARGETISRTEVQGALNTAMLAEAQATAPDLNKVWSCNFGINSRQDHMDADGQSVAQDEAFVVGGEELEEPGDDTGSPENVVNCECSMFFEPPEDAPPGSEAPESEQTTFEEVPVEEIPVPEVAPEVPAEATVANPLTNDIPEKGFSSTAKLNEWFVDNNIAEVSKIRGVDEDGRLQLAQAIKNVWEQNPELKAFREINMNAHGFPACVVYYPTTGETDLGIGMKALGKTVGRDAYWNNISATSWQDASYYKSSIKRIIGEGVMDSKTPFTATGYGDMDQTMFNTVLHEMGHKFQRDINPVEWNGIYRENQSEILRLGSAYGGGISARNPAAEGFAETHAMYRMGVTDRLPKAVVKFFDNIYGG